MTEPRLTSRAYEKHHKKSCNVQCDFTAMILFYQGKSKIDSGSNAHSELLLSVGPRSRKGQW
jgi:hypothetical protein